MPILGLMDQTPPVPEGSEPLDEAEDQTVYPLTAEEEAMIEEGLADIEAGRVVAWEDVRAWLRSLGTDHELPMPVPK